MVPKLCRYCFGIYSETCSFARGRNIFTFATLCAFMVEFDCVFVEEYSLLKQTISTFFFVDSCFGLILLFYYIYIAILVCSGQRFNFGQSPKSVYCSDHCAWTDHRSGIYVKTTTNKKGAIVLKLILDQASA